MERISREYASAPYLIHSVDRKRHACEWDGSR